MPANGQWDRADNCRTYPLGAGIVTDLWGLARERSGVHRFSTLFTAQDVRGRLANENGLAAALDWCKRTAVTQVYLECFRDGYEADRSTLSNALARFRAEGLGVSGYVTPTGVGKRSTGWNVISCYTDPATQERVKAIFEFAASLSDEVMIDDFWFTDCTCSACDAARQARTVTLGQRTYPVRGETWEDYRCELMVQLSRDYVLDAAKRVNPRVRLIIKYPQWYDRFHERGHEVIRQTRDFDRTWVGTETRDYQDRRWGGTVQYEAYFIMRWLGNLGRAKCGGGWFDPYGTTERTYVEQARQTVLGTAHEPSGRHSAERSSAPRQGRPQVAPRFAPGRSGSPPPTAVATVQDQLPCAEPGGAVSLQGRQLGDREFQRSAGGGGAERAETGGGSAGVAKAVVRQAVASFAGNHDEIAGQFPV